MLHADQWMPTRWDVVLRRFTCKMENIQVFMSQKTSAWMPGPKVSHLNIALYSITMPFTGSVCNIYASPKRKVVSLPAGARYLLFVEWGSSCVPAVALSCVASPSWQRRRRGERQAAGPNRGRPAPPPLYPTVLLPSYHAGKPPPWYVTSVGDGAQSASALQTCQNSMRVVHARKHIC